MPAASDRRLRDVIVGFDFSDNSERALALAITFFASDSRLHLVHALKPLSPGVTESEPSPQRIEAQVRDATQRVEAIASTLGKIEYRIWVRPGSPADVIIDVARTIRADVVTVGSRGSSGLQKFVFGSVAEAVFRTSPCPVLIVGPHVDNTREVRNVLYPTDLLSESYDALSYAVGLAESRSTHLTLLHIVDAARPESPEQSESVTGVYLDRLRRLLPSGVHFSYVPEFRVELSSSPVDAILQVAANITADIIVMDVRREETWASHLPDLASKLISRAQCPVLTSVERPHAHSEAAAVLVEGG